MKMIFCISLHYFITSNIYFSNAALTNQTDGLKVETKRICVLPNPEFKDILLSHCFVDKSLLIQDFLNGINKIFRVIRITAPSGFGKTMNLKMLKAFLQPENGLISSSQTKDCSLFIKHNLNIFKWNSTIFPIHCGKYPVIFINFKKITRNSFNDVLDTFREVIRDSFLEHGYLLNSTRLDGNEKYKISLYTDKIFYKNFSELQLLEALGYLSGKMYLHFTKKVIVLIDDFDAPVWKLLSTNFPIPDVYKTIYFIQNFMLSFLENNKYVQSGFINSNMRLSSVLLRQGNSITKLPFLEVHPYVKYYGLTEEEVREKLLYFNILHKYLDVKAHYNGYRTAGYYMYSTWSVLNYLQSEDMKDYWIAPDGLHNLSSVFLHTQVRKLFSQLLHGKTIGMHYMGEVSFRDIRIIRDIMTSTRDFNYAEVERFLLFLSDNGYFNAYRPLRDYKILLNIPNKQMQQHLSKQWFSNCSL